MSLWNLIRDFLVQNIFGGHLSNGDFIGDNIIGLVSDEHISSFDLANVNSLLVPIGNGVYSENIEFSGNVFLAFGDWLSTTFTIFILILLVIFLYIFVKWIFKLFSGLLH